MAFFLLLLNMLISVYSETTNEGEINCKKSRFDACEATELLSLFPLNEENLKEICSEYNQHFSCLKIYAMTCEHPVDYGGNIRYFDTYKESVCNEDSHIFKELRANIHCIEKAYTFKDWACGNQSENLIKALMLFREKTLYDYKIPKMSRDWFGKTAHGLIHLHDIGCFLRLTEECGENVRNSMIEMLKRIGHFEFSTPNFYIREKREIAEELLKELNLEDSLKNLIKEMLALQEFY